SDSLGLLDLDIPPSPCRYCSDNLILSDSFSGLNHLMASNLDAFQNWLFFGLYKKEATLAVEAQDTMPFSSYKIGSE
ncbi:unnamed protein product, partial [Ilex paraguariensis]